MYIGGARTSYPYRRTMRELALANIRETGDARVAKINAEAAQSVTRMQQTGETTRQSMILDSKEAFNTLLQGLLGGEGTQRGLVDVPGGYLPEAETNPAALPTAPSEVSVATPSPPSPYAPSQEIPAMTSGKKRPPFIGDAYEYGEGYTNNGFKELLRRIFRHSAIGDRFED